MQETGFLIFCLNIEQLMKESDGDRLARKTHDELEKIKQKYGVDELYSWSRYNTYKQSKYEYFLKYIQKIKEDKMDQVYTFAGSLFHEILEKFYRKEIKFEDMIDLFNICTEINKKSEK